MQVMRRASLRRNLGSRPERTHDPAADRSRISVVFCNP
jgi:hypothetical protein